MGIAAMAGHTGDGWNDIAFIILIKAEVFLIDLCRHLKHVAGDLFFGLGVAGKIQPMGGAVIGRGMAEITFHGQCGCPVVHDLVQVFMADVFGQDLEVSVRLVGQGLIRRVVRGAGGGHANDHQG